MNSSLSAFLLIGYGFLIGLILSPALASSETLAAFTANFVPQFAATILGVFAGAWITIHSEERKATIEEHRQRAAAANMTLFTLIRMYNMYLSILKDIVEPVRQHPAPWYSMYPMTIGINDIPRLQFDGLQFLFRSKSPNVVSQISIWQDRFHTLLSVIKQRSTLHVETLQPLTAAAGFVGDVDIRQLEAVVSVHIVTMLRTYTKEIIELVDEGTSEIPKLIRDLTEAASPMIGKEKLVRFDFSKKDEFLNKPSSTTAPQGQQHPTNHG